MIIKSYEINKIINSKKNIYLFYGENEGYKNEIIKNFFEINFLKKIYRYDEKEILENKENFYNSILTKSFFENEKLIIISRATDKIKDIVEEIIEKKVTDITIVLNANLLEKKSKLRNFFEKNKDAVCTPFYSDNSQTLTVIANQFFRKGKISISQETINLLVERCRGDRQNLYNEFNKIKSYIKNKKNINIYEVLKLTNLAENYNVSELADSCLAKNSKKTINILNENNYSVEDCILIVKTILIKSKRLLNIIKEMKNNKNTDDIISSYKPIIFWKDKEIIKQQTKNWSLNGLKNLIYSINDIELLIKKNSNNSINILSDFIINQSKTNNEL
jgi:DNA polymerase-3 subunit delta